IITIETNLDRLVTNEKISDQDKESTLENIITTVDLKQAVANADLVVEAATENLDLKLKIFKSLDEYCRDTTILATNTSSISITKIWTAISQPDRLIGMHFMYPVHLLPLSEVIIGYINIDTVLQH